MTFIELLQSNPKISIMVIAVIISVFSMLVTKFVTDQKRIKELKEKQKEKQKKAKEFRNDKQKVMELQKEIMGLTGELMKHSFKPLIITIIPLLIVFGFIRNVFTPVLSSWIWWYLIAAVISSSIFRKIFKVY